MRTAYLSALGMMGRRHLLGLVRAGFSVSASDPNPVVFDMARIELLKAGLPEDSLKAVPLPGGNYDVAIFAETTLDRLFNFQRFLSLASAEKILLEKPLSANPEEFLAFVASATHYGVEAKTQVNFIRRTWAHVQQLTSLCANESSFSVTLNGGAIGLGCMGIHYLDTFLALCSDEVPNVVWSALSDQAIASGRGSEFEDFGADFVLKGSRGKLLASLEAGSSANVVMTVRGAHFMAQVDYADRQWKLAQRKPDSRLPNYKYGADYQVIEQCKLELPTMDSVTELWALDRLQLSPLARAIEPHLLLDGILRAGGALPPYRFT